MEWLNPPGFADDFGRRPRDQDSFARGWHAIVDSWLTESAGLESGSFYHFGQDATPGEPVRQAVPWDAFPRFLQKWFEDEDDCDPKRWQAADTLRVRKPGGQLLRRVRDGRLAEPVKVYHRQQDEYCEWFAHRDAAGRITRVTFTSEGPEYWRFLADGTRAFFPEDDDRAAIVEGDISLVLELYQLHVDPSITMDDLVWPYDVAAYDPESEQWYLYGRAGRYNPFNKWNTTHGAMHLTHPANTLGAEVNLAARAAVLRQDASGRPIVDTEELICASGFGDPNRSSDPTIGAGVNGLAKEGMSISLADPVGLYIAGINTDAFRGPNGEDMAKAWRVDRGVADHGMVLRATFAAPESNDFTVDQIRAGGRPISWGGQIADEIQMVLTGITKRRGSESTEGHAPVAKCCEHPERPGIEVIIGLEDDCSQIDWSGIAPVMPGQTDEEALAPARNVGVTDEIVRERAPVVASVIRSR